MKVTTARIALFAPYPLDLRSGALRKFGTKVKRGEEAFQILWLLLERPGEMVTREELREKLWANDTFVDFDHGLNSAVQRLRDCLSDSAAKPRWIETLPRRGYRFIGQVEWSEKNTPSEAQPEPRDGSEEKSSEGLAALHTVQVLSTESRDQRVIGIQSPFATPSGTAQPAAPHRRHAIVLICAIILAAPLFFFLSARRRS